MKQIDPRVKRNISSLIALKKLLQTIIEAPKEFRAKGDLLKSLKSQGGFAKLDLPEHNITPTSLNTIKRISDSSLDGGFESLDKLRLAALRAIENALQQNKRSNKITRSGLSQRVVELESENRVLQQELLLFTQLLEKSMRQACYYAKASKDSRLEALCKKEIDELHAYLSVSHRLDNCSGAL